MYIYTYVNICTMDVYIYFHRETINHAKATASHTFHYN